MAKLIAVVDDNPTFLGLVQELLGEDGYRVATAYDQGLAAARPREARPDLIILAPVLEQPDGGWALLEEARRDPALAATPVILCTANPFGLTAYTADLRLYQDVAVLAKPFHIEVLVALVQRLIGPADDAAGGEIAGLGSSNRGAAGLRVPARAGALPEMPHRAVAGSRRPGLAGRRREGQRTVTSLVRRGLGASGIGHDLGGKGPGIVGGTAGHLAG